MVHEDIIKKDTPKQKVPLWAWISLGITIFFLVFWSYEIYAYYNGSIFNFNNEDNIIHVHTTPFNESIESTYYHQNNNTDNLSANATTDGYDNLTVADMTVSFSAPTTEPDLYLHNCTKVCDTYEYKCVFFWNDSYDITTETDNNDMFFYDCYPNLTQDVFFNYMFKMYSEGERDPNLITYQYSEGIINCSTELYCTNTTYNVVKTIPNKAEAYQIFIDVNTYQSVTTAYSTSNNYVTVNNNIQQPVASYK